MVISDSVSDQAIEISVRNVEVEVHVLKTVFCDACLKCEILQRMYRPLAFWAPRHFAAFESLFLLEY